MNTKTKRRWSYSVGVYLPTEGFPSLTSYDVQPGALEAFCKWCWEHGARVTRIEELNHNPRGGYVQPPVRVWS